MNSNNKSEKNERLVEFFDPKYMKYYINLAKPNFDPKALTRFYEKGHLFHEKKFNAKSQVESPTTGKPILISEKVTLSSSTQTNFKCGENEMEILSSRIQNLKNNLLTEIKIFILKNIKMCNTFKNLVIFLNFNRFKFYLVNNLKIDIFWTVLEKFYKINSFERFLLVFLAIFFVCIKTNLILALIEESCLLISIKQFFDEIISFKEPEIYEF
jgi:hypothetical protein